MLLCCIHRIGRSACCLVYDHMIMIDPTMSISAQSVSVRISRVSFEERTVLAVHLDFSVVGPR